MQCRTRWSLSRPAFFEGVGTWSGGLAIIFASNLISARWGVARKPCTALLPLIEWAVLVVSRGRARPWLPVLLAPCHLFLPDVQYKRLGAFSTKHTCRLSALSQEKEI